jgi:hypothetical protein
MYRIRAVLHVILITVVVGLAISYATLLSDLVPDFKLFRINWNILFIIAIDSTF